MESMEHIGKLIPFTPTCNDPSRAGESRHHSTCEAPSFASRSPNFPSLAPNICHPHALLLSRTIAVISEVIASPLPGIHDPIYP